MSAFARDLKLLFSQAYTAEDPTSGILLQQFLTGLEPSVSCQLLLRGKPVFLEEAIKDTGEIEYALSFESHTAPPKEVNVLPLKEQSTELEKLQETLEKMSKRLEELELSLNRKENSCFSGFQPTRIRREERGGSNQRSNRNHRQPLTQACWLCGELGHFQRNCHLNYSGPAQLVGGWPQK